ncbi:MAG: hypothetical protein KIT84_29500 [Labilithrix sp.]|nr:hypothetical protein [Labilithrix sp.]MCW5815199.1 hypothetical protein [Labilithrix sp.]
MPRLRGLLSLSLSFAALAGATSIACSEDALAPDEAFAADDTAPVTEEAQAKIDAFTRDGSAFDSAPPETSGFGFLHAVAQRLYSGFDGVHEFAIPVGFRGGGEDLTVVADDPAAANVTSVKATTPRPGPPTAYFMVTPKKAGLLAITATSGTQKVTARIAVAAYEPAQWETGAARYANGGANPACSSCHVTGRAHDHSPTALATVTDGDVAKIMTLGQKPGPTTITEVDHRWSMTDDERRGLIVYLRSLEPRGFSE